jgi:large subunit ribosomal protein L22
MEARAIAKYIRLSPQKARLLIDLIRGKKAEDALTVLSFNKKAAARSVTKVLKSAIANAENTKKCDVDKLYVKSAFVDQGPAIKRMHARAMGRGYPVKRRTSHITIVLDER